MPNARPAPARDDAPEVLQVPRAKATPDQVALIYGVTRKQVLAYARQRRIPSIKLGKYVRFDLDELERFIAEGRAAAVVGRTGASSPPAPRTVAPSRGRPRRVSVL